MIPISARRMIGRNVILILKYAPRCDRDQYVIAVPRRRDPQTMRVQVRVVEAKIFGALFLAARLELVVDGNVELLAGCDADGRTHEIARLRSRSDE